MVDQLGDLIRQMLPLRNASGRCQSKITNLTKINEGHRPMGSTCYQAEGSHHASRDDLSKFSVFRDWHYLYRPGEPLGIVGRSTFKIRAPDWRVRYCDCLCPWSDGR